MAEEKKKYCPLKFAIPLERVMSLDCDKGCAWWNRDYDECVLSRIARELTGINSQRDTDIYERKRGK